MKKGRAARQSGLSSFASDDRVRLLSRCLFGLLLDSLGCISGSARCSIGSTGRRISSRTRRGIGRTRRGISRTGRCIGCTSRSIGSCGTSGIHGSACGLGRLLGSRRRSLGCLLGRCTAARLTTATASGEHQ